MNVISPGIHDNDGTLVKEYAQTGKPVIVDGEGWMGGNCLKCTPTVPVGKATIEELRKARPGYSIE